jgi:hypothetical protein
MNKLFFTLSTIVLLSACKTSKDYMASSSDDKTFYEIVKKLTKHNSDENAAAALPQVYRVLQQKHLAIINQHYNSAELNHWDKVLASYRSLQQMHEAVSNTAAASLLTTVDYTNEINTVKLNAAEAYYNTGLAYLQNANRADARTAYTLFKKADSWKKGFKDARAQMDEAFERSVVNVLINPIQDNSFFTNAGWGNAVYNYANQHFQQNLVRDLGGQYASRYPARFYTEWQVNQQQIQPNWVVDLVLRNVDIPRPASNHYTRNRSKQIEVSRDTAGKPVYQTVYATVNIQRLSINARGQIDINITDVDTRKNISWDSVSDTYNWEEEIATYTGDSRALTNSDRAMLNNNYNQPRKEDILNELYRNMYSQVKSRIANQVDW